MPATTRGRPTFCCEFHLLFPGQCIAATSQQLGLSKNPMSHRMPCQEHAGCG